MQQNNLDDWLREYNESRPRSGKYCYGKTPIQTFPDFLPLAEEEMLQSGDTHRGELFKTFDGLFRCS